MHAVYPGTFDPVTLGHIDIIRRGLRMFSPLTVGVAANPGKNPLFSLQTRVQLIEDSCREAGITGDFRVLPFENLLIDFVADCEATVVLRGLRAVSDFEYEFQMASMNSRLRPAIETVFMMACENQHFVSSRFVREIALLGGEVDSFVSPCVLLALAQR